MKLIVALLVMTIGICSVLASSTATKEIKSKSSTKLNIGEGPGV